MLVLPWLAIFGVFWLYPLIYAAYMSLTDYSTLSGKSTFIGFGNYARIFKDEAFWIALKNTTVFTLGTVPVTTALALFLANLLNRKTTKFKEFFRSSYFMPSVASMVVIALIFSNLYAQNGYISLLLRALDLPYPERGFLQTELTALASIMAMDVWMAVGYYMVLFLAGMQAIPQDLYDSAKLAGAGAWTQFFRITLPSLRSTLVFVLVINTIKSFQVFVEVYVMTKGGPLGATTTLIYLVYEYAFTREDTMGYAAALAYVVFFLLLIFSFVQMRALRTK